MATEIKCNFTLKNSHKIKDIGFEGCNKVQLKTPIKIECPLGVEKTPIEISQIEKEKYEIKIKSSSLLDVKDQKNFIEKVSYYLSYLINKKELNPHYGTNFIEIEWQSFSSRKLNEDCSLETKDGILISSTITLDDSLSAKFSRNYEINSSEWQSFKYKNSTFAVKNI